MKEIFDIIKAAGFPLDGISISGDGQVQFNSDYPAKTEVAALVADKWDASKFASLKSSALGTVRAACESYILKAYPLSKQLNIVRQGVGYTPEDLEHMNHYIDEARLISNQVETAIQAATTAEEIEGVLTQAEAQYANDLPV